MFFAYPIRYDEQIERVILEMKYDLYFLYCFIFKNKIRLSVYLDVKINIK